MIHLTWLPDYLQAAVLIYMLLWLLATAYVLVKPTDTTQRRIINIIFVTMAFGLLPTYCSQQAKKYEEKQTPIVQHQQAQLQAAVTRFEDLCKKAEEKIYRTVENVEGIVWMKWRPNKSTTDQFDLTDPYGNNCSGLNCIGALLVDERMTEFEPNRWQPSHVRLYSYVDSIEPGASVYSRYVKPEFGKDIAKSVLHGAVSRYGVTWDDISTREDRELWIAGGRMQIVDLSTNEIIAERIGYLIDKGQGSKAGSRSPWSDAFSKDTACPTLREHNVSFITRVLIPKKQGK